METTQLTAKQKAIKEAYGDTWEKVKEFISPIDGSVPESKVHWNVFTNDITDYQHLADDDLNYYWRPWGVADIVLNNGWIRFDEKEPETGQLIDWINISASVYPDRNKYHPHMKHRDLFPTHWRPVLFDMPIY
jgi:hypothetical protein